jgi:uracil-DNA glycosylase family 4
MEHLRFLKEIGVRELAPSSAGSMNESADPVKLKKPDNSSRPTTAIKGDSGPAPLDETPAPSMKAGATGAEQMERLRVDGIGDCKDCRLCESRTNIVFGVGDPEARLLFVGEGPGRDEDIQGMPFVGRAGQLLTDIIKAMNLTREKVYIANIVKCRPPKNRPPEPDEIEACRGYLEEQIRIISPKIIVCLGGTAAQTLLGTGTGITKLRGEFREFSGIPVMPTYHPAYLLRSPSKKREVWEDMKQVMDILAG